MLNVQRRYLEYLSQLQETLSNGPIQVEKLESMTQAILEVQLLIPVIGAFSAGKSSLLNSYMGRDLLPVGITPETELATELRYSEEEHIEAICNDGSILHFTHKDMLKIKQRSSEFTHLRVFVTCERLKLIEPIVLVDMPGFDSTLANHNKALLYYLNRGVFYIALISVEDGCITQSMQRQLCDIQTFERDFSFLLSKTNLRADSEVIEVIKVISDQIESFFGEHKQVTAVGMDSGLVMVDLLSKINPEYIFQKQFLESLKNQHLSILENFNVAIVALKNNASENDEAILTMNTGLQNIIKKRDQLLIEVRDRYSNLGVNSFVEAVGQDLNNSVEELVTVAMSGNQEGFSRLVTDIIRSTLIRMIKARMSEISSLIIDEFAFELKDVNQVMSNLTGNDDWLVNFSDKSKALLEKTETILAALTDRLKTNSNGKSIYKILTTILAVTTEIVTPLIELIIIFIPDLLSGFLANLKREQIRNLVHSEVIPTIKSELRGKLPALFEEQLSQLINQIAGEFEQIISDKQQAVSLLEQQKKQSLSNIKNEIDRLTQLQEHIQKLAKNFLYTQEVAQ